jgi:DNA polymerase I-like protein with 3'-5' exonuclease and polymerase domains
VNADYAAMEQRIAADLSEDPALLALFRAGGRQSQRHCGADVFISARRRRRAATDNV